MVIGFVLVVIGLGLPANADSCDVPTRVRGAIAPKGGLRNMSPLVYGLLVQSATSMALPGLIVVALENGFCCLLVAENIARRTPANAGAAPAPD